jgi:hypothetical protein
MPQVEGTSPRLRFAGRELGLDRPLIMGIVNVTPDSFSDGGSFLDPGVAVEHALRLIADGADILDIGGESTRPGSDPVSAAEELRRVLPVFEALAGRVAVPLSIDTTKAVVAERAAAAGATLANDVSGLRFEPELADVVRERGLGLVLMHSRGRPKDMQQAPHYEDTVGEVIGELGEALGRAAGGVGPAGGARRARGGDRGRPGARLRQAPAGQPGAAGRRAAPAGGVAPAGARRPLAQGIPGPRHRGARRAAGAGDSCSRRRGGVRRCGDGARARRGGGAAGGGRRGGDPRRMRAGERPCLSS